MKNMKKTPWVSLLLCGMMLVNTVSAVAQSNMESESFPDQFIAEQGTTSKGPVSARINGAVPDDSNHPFSENQEQAEQERQSTGYEQNYSGKPSRTATTFTVEQATPQGEFILIQTYDSFDVAKSAMQDKADNAPNALTKNSYVVRADGRVVAMVNGMAIALGAGNTVLTLQNRFPYSYIVTTTTMYYEGTTSLDQVHVAVSGMRGTTSYDKLLLVPMPFMVGFADESFTKTNTYERGYYMKNSNGDLIHHITSLKKENEQDKKTHYEPGEGTKKEVLVVDQAPAFMEEGKRYYSMDGVHFYTDQLLSNEAGTYYPYFQYLSYRSKTSYTAQELEQAMAALAFPTDSVLWGEGQSFIDAQNTYGVNALLELAFGVHESGRGTSAIAREKNNIFGINAVDTDPGGQATTFESIAAGIDYHARVKMSREYFDALGDSRYFGTNAGNKAVGVNVAYASDPYHGQKVGGWAYRLDRALGGKDRRKYVIGVSGTSTPVYDTQTKNATLFQLRNNKTNNDLTGLPVIILKQAGEMYQVQSDMTVVNGRPQFDAPYTFSSVGYVDKSQVTLVSGELETSPEAELARLQELHDEALELNEADYTPESWVALRRAMQRATLVLGMQNPRLEIITDAIQRLEDAINNLMPVSESSETSGSPKSSETSGSSESSETSGSSESSETSPEADLERLQELHAEALKLTLELNQADYTPESWAVLKRAMDQAASVLEMENPTSEDLTHAIELLDKAMKNLEPVSESSGSSKPSESSESSKPSESSKSSPDVSASVQPSNSVSAGGSNPSTADHAFSQITLLVAALVSLSAASLLIIKKKSKQD